MRADGRRESAPARESIYPLSDPADTAQRASSGQEPPAWRILVRARLPAGAPRPCIAGPGGRSLRISQLCDRGHGCVEHDRRKLHGQQSGRGHTSTRVDPPDGRRLCSPGTPRREPRERPHRPYGTGSTTARANRAFLMFDLAGLSGCDVAAAQLSLYFEAEDYPGVSPTLEVHRVTASWTESSVTWSSRSSGTPWTEPRGVTSMLPRRVRSW
jgi:hypothetical protein